jgi:hypothetical protein
MLPIQIEHAGSTIFQTLAGWLLDTTVTKKPSFQQTSATSLGSNSTQHLLNTFVLLNILEFCGIMALSWLDRQQKMFARRGHRLLNTDGTPRQMSDVNGSLVHGDMPEDESWTDDTISEDLDIPLASSTEEVVSWGEERSTGARRNSRLSIRRSTPTKPTKVKRGEICALLCGALIVLTWVLFFVTAVLRLRSKDDRAVTDKPSS